MGATRLRQAHPPTPGQTCPAQSDPIRPHPVWSGPTSGTPSDPARLHWGLSSQRVRPGPREWLLLASILDSQDEQRNQGKGMGQAPICAGGQFMPSAVLSQAYGSRFSVCQLEALLQLLECFPFSLLIHYHCLFKDGCIIYLFLEAFPD